MEEGEKELIVAGNGPRWWWSGGREAGWIVPFVVEGDGAE